MDSSLNAQTSLLTSQIGQSLPLESATNAKRSTEDIDQIAREFESVFIYEMMKPMFEGIDVDPVFGGGKGEEIFRGMMLQEYGKNIANKNITGLQNHVQAKLIELQSEGQ
ncbi:MAG: rod-binding protein [Alphaproteobacteria bacterium]